MATYWQDSDGLAWLVQDGASAAPGWVKITQDAYVESVTAQEMAIAEHKAEMSDGDCAARKAVYEDLTASVHTKDWDEATIRFVARYTPGEC